MRVLTTEEILNLETSSVQAWRPFLPSLFFITHSWHRSRMCSSAVVMVISSLLLLVAMPLNTWCNRIRSQRHWLVWFLGRFDYTAPWLRFPATQQQRSFVHAYGKG
ncbi:predicted protein [Lichtheimia corymbifera JMRC:FSU:9682]|uniref:Uncharacterized protein n=1 Tax=Lichtheimia corymbifera JMRC:FSU:9682 TaxID=1263082 RepID=A0A068RFA5_9FUNG|nr:predicted protein [Lichtheimia corymbifera JMRC:FSU:9682]